ncbi:MAG: hypothetical protein NUV67_00230 [archaeon]|nr:hypothetical protein [archaeon]
MAKQLYFYLTAIAAVAIIVVGAFVLMNLPKDYKYSVEKDGVRLVSNEKEISELLSSYRAADSFIISPRFVERGTENVYMLSSVTLFNTILIDKGKSVIVVARVLDENQNLASCRTNLGNAQTDKILDAKDCAILLEAEDSVVAMVSFPKDGASLGLVELSEGKISITPASFEDVGWASFVFLESLYPDAQDIIDRVNLIVQRL